MNLDNWIFITVIIAPLKKKIPGVKHTDALINSVRKMCLIFIQITFKNLNIFLNIPFSFFQQNIIYYLWFWGPGFVRFTPTWMKFHFNIIKYQVVWSDTFLNIKSRRHKNQWYLLKTSHWNVISRKFRPDLNQRSCDEHISVCSGYSRAPLSHVHL